MAESRVPPLPLSPFVTSRAANGPCLLRGKGRQSPSARVETPKMALSSALSIVAAAAAAARVVVLRRIFLARRLSPPGWLVLTGCHLLRNYRLRGVPNDVSLLVHSWCIYWRLLSMPRLI
jgi:hypothetical protein